ncbi:MAG: flagellar motor switch protein FliM [Actinomycetota bacterium]|nr:flagellar motor switch protein FliM [Actinomycetota bacterium]
MPGVLSQEEINALLSTSSQPEETITTETADGRRKQVRVYDFRHPDKFSKSHLHVIETIHQAFARQVAAALLVYMRQNVNFILASVEQIAFDDYTASLSAPTTLIVFSLSPLPGNAVMELNPTLTFMFYDKLLGGSGLALSENRELTDIERSVISGITTKILEAFKDSWSSITNFNPKIEAIETNPQLVQIVPPGEIMADIVFEVRMGATTGAMSICLPYLTLESIIPKLTRKVWFAAKSEAEKADAKQKGYIKESLEPVHLPVTVELGSVDITIGELLDLKVGDALQLGTRVDQELKVKIGEHVKFYGKPGILAKKYAVRTTSYAQGEE